VYCAKERAAGWAKANPGRRRDIVNAYSARHRETENERLRGHRHRTREQSRAKTRAWRRANPDKHAAKEARRRAVKLKATPAWLSADDFWLIGEVYALSALRTAVTGVEHHVDHIIPLQGRIARGLHVPWNLQVLVGADNVAKSNRLHA